MSSRVNSIRASWTVRLDVSRFVFSACSVRVCVCVCVLCRMCLGTFNHFRLPLECRSVYYPALSNFPSDFSTERKLPTPNRMTRQELFCIRICPVRSFSSHTQSVLSSTILSLPPSLSLFPGSAWRVASPSVRLSCSFSPFFHLPLSLSLSLSSFSSKWLFSHYQDTQSPIQLT